MNLTMDTDQSGANVEHDRWKATTAKNEDKKKRYRLNTMMPGRVRDPSIWRTELEFLNFYGAQESIPRNQFRQAA
jgi:hypothetical protein